MFAPGASAYIFTPLRPRQLRCARPTNPCGGGRCVGYGECSAAASPPLCEGSLRWRSPTRRNTLPNFVRPARLPFVALTALRRRCLQSVKSNADTRPTHLDYTPAPGRCAVRRCSRSTPAVGQPLRSLRVSLRIRARAGRLTVCGASSSTESLSLRASATPAVCANPIVGTPSSLRSFGRHAYATHGIVITAHRHHQTH